MGVAASPGLFTIGEAGEAAAVEGLPSMVGSLQPDSIVDAGVVGGLTIRAASVRGAGHRYDGTPRQDDFCIGATADHLVIAVADGVSAGPRSHVAARAAVRFGVQALLDAIDACVGDPVAGDPVAGDLGVRDPGVERGGGEVDPLGAIAWDELVGSTAGYVLAQARNEAGDPALDARDAARAMATTIAFVIVPLEAARDGTRACTVVPLGDTSVFVLRGGAVWEPISAVKNEGEAVATSSTFALPMLPSAPVAPIITVLDPGDALFALTDGVGDPLGRGDGEVGEALASVWAAPPHRFAFAATVDFGRRSHTDDRTVVGVWPDAQPAANDLGVVDGAVGSVSEALGSAGPDAAVAPDGSASGDATR